MRWFSLCSRLGRESVLVALGQATAGIGTIIGLRVLTGALSPQQFGEFSLGLTVGTFVAMIASGPGLAATRFFASALESHQFASFLKASWAMLLRRVWIMAFVAILLLVTIWLTGNAGWTKIVIATTVASTFIAFSTIFDGIQTAARQRAIVAWHAGVSQWFRFLVALALFRIFGTSSAVAMSGYCVALALVLTSQYFFFGSFRKGIIRDQPPPGPGELESWLRRMNAYAWPAALFGAFDWISTNSGRWALQLFVDSQSVGLFSALLQVGFGPMLLASNFVSQLSGPVLFSRAGDGTDQVRTSSARKLTIRILSVFASVSSLMGLLTIPFHKEILSLFVASQFRDVSYLLPIVVFSGIFLACGHIAVFLILSGGETRSLLKPKICTMVLSVMLNFVGARWFGLAGVVWAGLFLSLFYLASVLYVAITKQSGAQRVPVALADERMTV